jgi:hypothetical protein
LLRKTSATCLSHFPAESWTSPGACWLCESFGDYGSAFLEFTAAGAAAAGMFTWRPAGKRFSQLCGFDVLPCEACSPIGTPGDLDLADLSQYVIVQRRSRRRSPVMSFSIRTRAPSGSHIELMVSRPGRRPVISEQGGVEMSPFIILAERSSGSRGTVSAPLFRHRRRRRCSSRHPPGSRFRLRVLGVHE